MKIEKTDEYIVVHGDFKVLSSAIYNGGYRLSKAILNLTVATDFNEDAFERFDSFIAEHDLVGEELVGMMTAVGMNDASIIERGDVTAIITAGKSKPPSRLSSTINIILLLNKNLSQSAMANVIIVATEAKTTACYDLDIHVEDGDLFTGDATDSVVVACPRTGDEAEELFAGKATALGSTLYEVVREGVRDALVFHDALTADRHILIRLEERGIFLDDMVSAALELYVPAEGEEVDKADLQRRLEETIKKESSDVNVALLLAAAIHAEEIEILKGRAGKAGETDAASIVADELIGIDIAEYIGGKKALFNFIYYDTRKPGILNQLGVFMDDAIGGLIAGCMTKMLG